MHGSRWIEGLGKLGLHVGDMYGTGLWITVQCLCTLSKNCSCKCIIHQQRLLHVARKTVWKKVVWSHTISETTCKMDLQQQVDNRLNNYCCQGIEAFIIPEQLALQYFADLHDDLVTSPESHLCTFGHIIQTICHLIKTRWGLGGWQHNGPVCYLVH